MQASAFEPVDKPETRGGARRIESTVRGVTARHRSSIVRLGALAASAPRMEDVRHLTVRLRLSDPALVDDLLFFFRKRDSQAELVEDDVVEVAIFNVLDDRQGRLELDLYLRVWDALHPDASVYVLRDG